MNTIDRRKFMIVVTRVRQRLLPVLMSYALSFTFAIVVSLLLMSSLRTAFRRPLLAEALNARSLDLLLDALTATVEGGSPFLTLIGMVVLPLAFLASWGLRIVIEGGALHSYDSEEKVPFRDFMRAGWRWLMPFFGQGLISVGVYLLCILVPLLIPLLMRFIGGGIARTINSGVTVMMALLACLWTIVAEIARANAIVDNERNIAVCLWEALRIVRKIPWAVLALHGASAVSAMLLMAAAFGLNRVIPLQWWLLSFVLLQGVAVLRVGVRLVRWAGNIALVQACAPPAYSPNGIS